MIYVAALVEPIVMLVYLSCEAQVIPLTSKEISTKYFNISDIYSLNSAIKLSEYTRVNYYVINLLNIQQLLYSLIYSLKQVELKTLKIYFKANLASSFIKPAKFFAITSILFI